MPSQAGVILQSEHIKCEKQIELENDGAENRFFEWVFT